MTTTAPQAENDEQLCRRTEARLGRPVGKGRRIDPWRGKRLPPEILDQMPPQDVALERAVIGWMILHHDQPHRWDGVPAWDFTWPWGRVFVTMRKWVGRASFFYDLLTELRAADVATAADLAEAVFATDEVFSIGVRPALQRLRELRIARERIHLATALLQLAYFGPAAFNETEQRWLRQARTLLNHLQRYGT